MGKPYPNHPGMAGIDKGRGWPLPTLPTHIGYYRYQPDNVGLRNLVIRDQNNNAMVNLNLSHRQLRGWLTMLHQDERLHVAQQ